MRPSTTYQTPTKETSVSELTISGKTFTVNPPYVPGHVLKENEASTLNQTWMENIRNNFAKKVSEAEGNGTSHELLQSALNEYAAKYEFGVRSGLGGRTTDPVEQEARRLAKAHVHAKLKAKGLDVAKFTSAAITDAALRLLDHPDHGHHIRTEAAATVEKLRRAGSQDLSDEFLPEVETVD